MSSVGWVRSFHRQRPVAAIDAIFQSASSLDLRLCAGLLAASFLVLVASPRGMPRAWSGSVLLPAAAFTLVFFAACLGYYASTPVLIDHVEPGTLSIAAAWRQGQPLYPAPDAAERYGYQYGPYLYLAHAWGIAWFGHSIQAGKLPAVLAAALALGLVYRLGAVRGNARVALLATAYLAVGLMLAKPDPHGAYWCRPEPQIVLAVVIGWNAIYASRCVLAGLLCGVALGVACNEKFFALAYFLPILVVLGQHHGVRGLILTGVTGFGVLALPFLLVPGVSAPNYLAELEGATRHGFSVSYMPQTLRLSVYLALPFAALMVGQRLPRPRAMPAFAGAVAFAAVVFFSSKLGAGPYYLLPLLPSAAVYLLECLRLDSPEEESLSHARRAGMQALLAAFVLVTLPACIQEQLAVVHMQADRVAARREALAELDAARQRYPNVGIGLAPGGADTYPQTFVHPWLVIHGEPYFLDPGAMMDFQRSGQPIPASTRARLKSGEISVWLVPAGDAPFSLPSLYPPWPPLFDEEFRRDFAETFEKVDTGKHFDVWVRR